MIKVSLKGFDELKKRVDKAPKTVADQVDAETFETAREYALLAKQSAQSQFGDFGNLAGGIQPQKSGRFTAFVFSNAKYSAYIEWGTITKVFVPDDLKDYAIQFKGKGLRKNGGIIPRPYFFKHKEVVQKNFVERVKTILEGI